MRIFAASVFALVALHSAPALACSAPVCSPNVLFPAGGTLPANMLKVRFSPGGSYQSWEAGLPEPRLFDSLNMSVPFDRSPTSGGGEWLEPRDSVPVGTVLRVEVDAPPQCTQGGAPLKAMYTVGEAKPLPTSIGTLTASLQRGVIAVAASASCSVSPDAAYADVRVQLPADAQPYAALFAYDTYVDGMLKDPFRSSLVEGEARPQGEDRLYAACVPSGTAVGSKPGQGALSLGTHTVRFEGTLPDGTKLSTPELSITLACAGSTPDASVPTKQDAGVRTDASVTGGVDGGTLTSFEDDGCALATRGNGAWLAALALFLLRRRKR